MHPYLLSFCNNDFSEYLSDSEIKKIDENFEIEKDKILPMVEIPKFDIHLLSKIKHIAEEKYKHQFRYNVGSEYWNDWFYPPRSDGWQEISLIKRKTTESGLLHDNKTFTRHNKPPVDNPELLEMCLNVLDYPDHLENLNILRFEPGGYLAPHRDLQEKTLTLWIPLHEFPVCFKMFPFGWMQHKFGCGYVINTHRYVHAVLNGKIPRYVITCRYSTTSIDPNIEKWYYENKSSWKNLYEN